MPSAVCNGGRGEFILVCCQCNAVLGGVSNHHVLLVAILAIGVLRYNDFRFVLPIQPHNPFVDFAFAAKVHAVSINGGSLYPLKEGEVSPELKLRKGLNVICVIGNDVNTMKTAKYYSKNYDEIGMVSYVLLVYSNEDSEGYVKCLGYIWVTYII